MGEWASQISRMDHHRSFRERERERQRERDRGGERERELRVDTWEGDCVSSSERTSAIDKSTLFISESRFCQQVTTTILGIHRAPSRVQYARFNQKFPKRGILMATTKPGIVLISGMWLSPSTPDSFLPVRSGHQILKGRGYEMTVLVNECLRLHIVAVQTFGVVSF